MDTGSAERFMENRDGLVRKEGLMTDMRRVWLRSGRLKMIPTRGSICMSLRGMQTRS